MKKYLLSLLALFLSFNAYAGTITLETISADSSATVHNSNFSTLGNLVNGNIEGSSDSGSTVANIKADSIFEINMANDANPRVRDSELFANTVDTISGGAASSQGSYVYSGCVPATDTDLTSDVSACTVYINGYRVVKTATAQTYANNTTTYLWLSQTGSYTQSTNPNTSISNSALLSRVVTSGGQITTVTDLANRRLPGLLLPSNYRDGLIVSKDSTTTVSVLPGSAEINSTMVTKTSTTTLTISNAADYAGGSSLRAANTYGFVGMDTSGNLKLHTTAPAYDNYAVSTTAGKKRYATWSGTVYRILGWFYMDGAQLVENASNIKEAGLANIIQSNDTTIVSVTGTSFAERQRANFYNSGGVIRLSGIMSIDVGVTDGLSIEFGRSGTVIPGSGNSSASSNAANPTGVSSTYLDLNRPQGTAYYSVYSKMISGTLNTNRRALVVEEA